MNSRITTYSNGWGHLIVTLAVLAMSTAFLYFHLVDATSVMGMIGTVVAFWFLSGSSKFNLPTEPPQSPPASLQPQNGASTAGTLP